jgi:hypothetical protein
MIVWLFLHSFIVYTKTNPRRLQFSTAFICNMTCLSDCYSFSVDDVLCVAIPLSNNSGYGFAYLHVGSHQEQTRNVLKLH